MAAKKIELESLHVQNFKGFKDYYAKFDNKRTLVIGENGEGKTSLYDSFLYLMFGKDSAGRSDFGLRPLDSKNRPIQGLVLKVIGVLIIDGRRHVLRKEQQEDVNKQGQITSYPTKCWIDDVYTPVQKYKKYINELINEDTFRLLTDLRYFNEKMKWPQRRAVLLDMAGEVTKPEGFGDLITAMAGRHIDDYKKVLTDRKKGHEDERDKNNTRLDENRQKLGKYEQEDATSLTARRVELRAKHDETNKAIQDLLSDAQQRQSALTQLNTLKGNLANRERDLANDTSKVNHLIQERSNLKAELANAKQAITDIDNEINLLQTQANGKCNQISILKPTIDASALEYQTAMQEEMSTNCPECHKPWDADRIEELKAIKQRRLDAIARKGTGANDQVKKLRIELDNLQRGIKLLEQKRGALQTGLTEAEQKTNRRIAEITQAIAADEKTPPAQDPQWLALNDQITKLEIQIGPPSDQQLKALTDSRENIVGKLNDLDAALARIDTINEIKQRIIDLEARKKELAQLIADLNAQLKQIENYKVCESQAIEASVNGLFAHVDFKLFNFKLNGSKPECCIAVLRGKGTEYPDMSTGESILAGVDVINVLSRHYGVNVPLFIDRAESVTLAIEAATQTIELYAIKGKCLTIASDGDAQLAKAS